MRPRWYRKEPREAFHMDSELQRSAGVHPGKRSSADSQCQSCKAEGTPSRPGRWDKECFWDGQREPRLVGPQTVGWEVGALTVGRKALGRMEFQEPKAGEGPRDWGSCQLRLQQGWGGREGKGAGQ